VRRQRKLDCFVASAPRDDGFGPIPSAAAQNGAVVYPDGLDPAHPSASGARNFRRTSLREKTKLLSRFNKSTRRANHPKTLSSPSRKNIPLSPSGKSLI